MHKRIYFLILIILLAVTLAGCDLTPPANPTPPAPDPEDQTAPPPLSTPIPPPPETQIEFRVRVPANTAPEDTIYLTILDEVTGLALNSKSYSMELVGPAPEIDGLAHSEIGYE